MHTSERLALEMERQSCPADMVTRARDKYYDDYQSPLDMPKQQLVIDLIRAGCALLADEVRNGRYDNTQEESLEWLRSEDGQEAQRLVENGVIMSPKMFYDLLRELGGDPH